MKRVISLAILLSVAGVASAETLKFRGTGLGEVVDISGVQHARVFAGQLLFRDSGNVNLTTYCADLLHFIHVGQIYGVDALYTNTQSAGIHAAGNIVAASASSIDSNAKAAGLQLAVWEAVYDNGAAADFKHGSFKVTAPSQVLNYAEQYYGHKSQDGVARYFKPTPKGSGQDQIEAVPEPATLAILALGAVALRRRNKR